jgi:hypothetical protein
MRRTLCRIEGVCPLQRTIQRKETTMPKNDNLQWFEVDPADLTGTIAKLYKTYKAKSAEATAARNEFENAFKRAAETGKKIPEGKGILFSHKFGKLSIAFPDAAQTQAKRSGSKFKL